ncbi:MAG: mechanosensitive ion channel family protein [Nanoarchaeota archaeon]
MNITNTTQLLNDLNTIVTQNTTNDYLLALAAFAGVIIILKVFQLYIVHRIKIFAKKTKTKIDDMAIEFIEQLGWPFNAAISLFVVSKFLTLPGFIDLAINYFLVIIIVFYAARGVFRAIDAVVSEQIKEQQKKKDASSSQMIRILGTIAKIILGVIAALLILSNLGLNISSLLAGVGIGGIAIAFALQNILSDLFSSFSIYFDKPFVEGDFIIVGNDMGTVEKIGLKSTRIKALQGHELVISNNELTSARINNYKKMEERRVAFTIGVTYETSVAKLKKIPKLIEDIINKTDNATFDRANFKSYGDFSLIFEIVYYVGTDDYNEYMNTHEKINLAIAEKFQKEKIQFAYTTQTIYMGKSQG